MWLYMGIIVDFLICLRLTRYMRIHVGLKAFYQVMAAKVYGHLHKGVEQQCNAPTMPNDAV